MSRVTQSHSMEFGATEPRMEGFRERGSFLSGLFDMGRRFRNAEPLQNPSDLALPRAIGEVPRLPVGSPPLNDAHVSSQTSTTSAPSLSPGDEIERLVLHVAASDRPAQACRVLVTHVPCEEAPLGGLDCAAFASQFARALAFEGRAILVIFGAGSGRRLGLSDLVAGTASFSEAIHRESGSRLHILPPGHGRVEPGAGLSAAMDALAETYDFVVLAVLDEDRDAAQALALSLAPVANHAVIGCAGQTGSPDMIDWSQALKEAGAQDVLAARLGASRAQELAA